MGVRERKELQVTSFLAYLTRWGHRKKRWFGGRRDEVKCRAQAAVILLVDCPWDEGSSSLEGWAWRNVWEPPT